MDLSGNVVGIVTARLGDIPILKITGSLPQNVNYALKSGWVIPCLETIPDLTGKLKFPNRAKESLFSDVADKAKLAVVIVTSY